MDLLLAHTAVPDMSGIVVILVFIGVVAFLGVVAVVLNCYLAVVAPRVNRWLLGVNSLVSLGLTAILFALGFNVGANAPHDKNWWCLTGGAAVLLTATIGWCRSLSRTFDPNRSRRVWQIGFAVAALLLVVGWLICKLLFGPR